ncbi:CLUMA_CG011605, isoform A [Clunio marinus]|uniref:CLUMA_CG011605, isoform A n=1 Tax=Clunio marinus TaxID=568069 RepID=A0A1J1IDE9_9DIPT|nr:CLUMA_CG011605, isoform A [Clunio marinus]
MQSHQEGRISSDWGLQTLLKLCHEKVHTMCTFDIKQQSTCNTSEPFPFHMLLLMELNNSLTAAMILQNARESIWIKTWDENMFSCSKLHLKH